MQKAFTLVELSIVLLIIALIIGGTMSGKNLINNSKLRSIISETGEYIRAVENFKNIYVTNGNGCLPGDCINATSFFGTTDINGKTVNNGNGNGFIGSAATNDLESLGAWQHLSLGGLINGTFTGAIFATSSSNVLTGWNAPGSGYSPDITYLFYSSNINSNYQLNNSIAACQLLANTNCNEKINVSDAYSIDQKVDDGLPYTGRIISFSDIIGNCVSTNNLSTKVAHTFPYLSGSNSNCRMLFALNGFIYN